MVRTRDAVPLLRVMNPRVVGDMRRGKGVRKEHLAREQVSWRKNVDKLLEVELLILVQIKLLPNDVNKSSEGLIRERLLGKGFDHKL